MIREWTIERKEIMEANQRLEILARDRLNEIENYTHMNCKLMLRLAMSYAEVERLSTAAKRRSK